MQLTQKGKAKTDLESEGSQTRTQTSQKRSARTVVAVAIQNPTAGPKEEAKKGKAPGRGKLRKLRQQR